MSGNRTVYGLSFGNDGITPSGGRQVPSYMGFRFSFMASWRLASSSADVQMQG